MPVTMGVLVDCITAIAKAISSEPLLRAIHRPEPSAAVAQCFGNVQRKAERDGGGVLFGWMFHYREVAAIPGPGYVIAVNHAVWHSPGKS